MIEWLVRKAQEVDDVKSFGLSLGLSQAEVDEVIQAWIEWAIPRPHALPWDRVRLSMIDHMSGNAWRP